MFGNKKRFEEMNKEIASLKDRVEVLEFEKKNPSGLEIRTSGTYVGVGDTILKYIKNGKVKEFTLEKGMIFTNSTWKLDSDIIVNNITDREGFSSGMMAKYITITKKYKFDIENERLVELCITSTIEELDFKKIAEEKTKEDLVNVIDDIDKDKKKRKYVKKTKAVYNGNAGAIMLENKDAIIKLKNNGYTNQQIAQKYGVGITSVWRLLNNKTIKSAIKPTKQEKNRKLLEDEMGNILKARENGVTIKELSEKYGIAKTTIRDAIERHTKAKIQNNLIAELENDNIDYGTKNIFSK
jgi:transposase